MSDSHFYHATYLMSQEDHDSKRITDLWHFKSSKSHKRYIVEIENFPHHFYGIKFYWKATANSKYRYSILTHDYEPRTIIMSCVHIMMSYYNHDNSASFGFVAAPDNRTTAVNCDGPNKRFRFYRRMMLSIFGEKTFVQAYDLNNAIYLLINRHRLESGKIDVKTFEDMISDIYEGLYEMQIP